MDEFAQGHVEDQSAPKYRQEECFCQAARERHESYSRKGEQDDDGSKIGHRLGARESAAFVRWRRKKQERWEKDDKAGQCE